MQAARDDNFVTTLLAVSSVDGVTPVTLYANPTTHRLLVDLAGGGSGTVQTISIATANGFAGTSDADPNNPTLTLSTTITGILKGNGTAISAVTIGSGLSYDGTTLSATGGSGITVGTTTITSGTNTRILYNNSGVVGEYTLTGSGTVVAMQTAPTFATSITTPAVLATANDSGALGASGTAFSDLFLASGGVINWNAGDVVLTHSADRLTMTGGGLTVERAGTPAIMLNNSDLATVQALILDGDRATLAANDNVYFSMRLSDSAGNQDEFARITATATSVTSTTEAGSLTIGVMTGGTLTNEIVLTPTALTPFANDGLALGSTTLQYSDLFLAEGGVINWDNGDMTITQASNVMTIAGGNVLNNNFVSSYTTTATAAGTTTLTVDSTHFQFFTGSTTQTVTLPVTSTLTTGHSYFIKNLSSGVVTVNSSGGNLVASVAAGATVFVTCILTSGTTAASWNANLTALFYAGGKTLTVNNSLTLAGTDGTTMTFPSADATIAGIASTQTLTNKRITKRTGTTTSSATPTINTNNVDYYSITAQAVDITSMTTNLSGTPTTAQQLRIDITGTAARAITWGASFANGPVALPTTTVTTTRLYVLLEWDGSIWRCMASGSTV